MICRQLRRATVTALRNLFLGRALGGLAVCFEVLWGTSDHLKERAWKWPEWSKTGWIPAKAPWDFRNKVCSPLGSDLGCSRSRVGCSCCCTDLRFAKATKALIAFCKAWAPSQRVLLFLPLGVKFPVGRLLRIHRNCHRSCKTVSSLWLNRPANISVSCKFCKQSYSEIH